MFLGAEWSPTPRHERSPTPAPAQMPLVLRRQVPRSLRQRRTCVRAGEWRSVCLSRAGGPLRGGEESSDILRGCKDGRGGLLGEREGDGQRMDDGRTHGVAHDPLFRYLDLRDGTRIIVDRREGTDFR